MTVAESAAEIASTELTSALVDDVSSLLEAPLPPEVVTVARHCLLDFLGVAIAGATEPLVEILVAELASSAGGATLVGRAERASRIDAALINGAAGHALDYDDTLSAMNGHPTVPVMPAVLALAESLGLGGRQLLVAFVAGAETEARLGRLMGAPHYAAGFHATGTLGTFGAAAAACHLLGLDRSRTTVALGLAGTQAAGLKASFGTMAKPLHAGRAASTGLLSALLASRGFSGRADLLEARHGFGATHASGRLDPDRLTACRGRFFILETLFKHHAACYLTHAAIEAGSSLVAGSAVRHGQIVRVEVEAAPALGDVCGIERPATGLELKFSLRGAAALALLGRDTADPETWNDATAGDPEVIRMRERVTVVPVEDFAATRAKMRLFLEDGSVREADRDTGTPAADLDRQGERLERKFRALTAPVLGDARAETMAAGIAAIAGPGEDAAVGEWLRATVPAG